MNGGRRNLKQAASDHDFTLKQCQSIVSLRGSNQFEIMDVKGDNSSALFKLKKRRLNGSCSLLIMGSFLALTQQERRRRRRERRIGRDRSEIPLDLVVEILIRLPLKCLARFKCVSKQCSSLFSSRYFCDRLFTVTRRKQQQPRLYMSLLDEVGQRLLMSISSTSSDNTHFVDLSIPGMGGFFLNSLHGLMCFSVREKACIYNPTTGQRLTLPKIQPDIRPEGDQWKHHNRYFIGHDPVNDEYKLFCTIIISSDYFVHVESEHWVFVLKAGGSWRKVVPHENYRPHAHLSPFSQGRSISGSVVHYLAWHDMYTLALVSFDVRSEEFTTILAPDEFGPLVHLPAEETMADLIEYGGKIAIFEHSYLKKGGVAELWVLEDFEKQEWSKTILNLQPCQRHLVNDTKLIVKGTTQDGRVILAPLEMHSQFYTLCYDLESNDLRKVEIKGVPHLWFDKKCYFDLRLMDENDTLAYLET